MTKMINKKFFALLAGTMFFAGCHTITPTTNIHDSEMTCSEIEMEIAKTEALQKEIQGNCGISGRNALGLLFWPSIIVNEVTGTAAQKAATDRIDHLNALHAQKHNSEDHSHAKN